jgi:hypothetical protein
MKAEYAQLLKEASQAKAANNSSSALNTLQTLQFLVNEDRSASSGLKKKVDALIFEIEHPEEYTAQVLEKAEQARKAKESQEQRQVEQGLLKKANQHFQVGAYMDAVDYYRQYIALFPRGDKNKDLAHGYWNVALCYQRHAATLAEEPALQDIMLRKALVNVKTAQGLYPQNANYDLKECARLITVLNCTLNQIPADATPSSSNPQADDQTLSDDDAITILLSMNSKTYLPAKVKATVQPFDSNSNKVVDSDNGTSLSNDGDSYDKVRP